MDAKVIVEVTCPYCHIKIMMKKKVGLSSMTIKCPQKDCGKELNIIFDTNKNPQTYKFIYESKDRGKKKTIYTVGKSKIFEGLGDSFQAARYHSLAAVRDELPDTLRVTAEAENGEIMAVEHTEYPIYGVQFHPESVMTPDGKVMVQNFINIVKK